MSSVNTNYGALVALQNLNATTKDLNTVQARVNTGLKVASAKDNGAIFAIAEGLRNRVNSLAVVRDGIDRGNTIIDTSLAAGNAISDILKQMKEKSVAAQATDLSTAQRSALQADFNALRAQVDQVANSATFNGANLINGTNTGLNALSVLTTDSTSGGSATQYTASGVGAALAGTDVVETVLGVAGDTIDFTFNSGETIRVDTLAGETVSQFVTRVGEATNGRVSASLSSTGTISYSSSEQFQVDVTGTAAAAAANQFGEGRTAQRAVTSGFTLSGGAITTANVTEETDLVTATGFGADVAATDILRVFSSDGSVIGSVTITANMTAKQFSDALAGATEGRVQARLVNTGASAATLQYTSNESFFLGFDNVAGGAPAAANIQGLLGATATQSAPVVALNGEDFQSARSGAVASSASNSVTLNGFDFRLGQSGALQNVTTALDISTSSGATTAAGAIDTALDTLNRNLATLGSQSKALEIQRTFLGKLGDELEKGVGALVDADLAKESARLQSLQIKQQLGVQALSIANQAPSLVLSLFR
jgi:flagellin